ncbi:ribosomal protein S18-alanine N-acetyltransferase [Arsenophonus sp. aPb]|uniref:ribosomal protein S18-alanine N-acetyltransferase n=1 Tax=Arsenophonus sp. aPb TaxID=3041619 RepID=UPI00246973DE|nr:ribosomal protein S18-alanine N-acetyltransferase [Arsenophonus sp. aPb]WGL97853.1 ribosomal protein S18-alanine N-acetyltransferase [Arsenophonus sp. aPb]
MKIISNLVQSDLISAFAIEKMSHAFPWSEKVFYSNQGKQYINLKISAENRLIGFAITQCLLDEATLFNIAIHPNYQGQGYGEYLLRYLIDHLATKNIQTLWLEVRQSNYAAIHLYEKLGFHIVTIRKNYYPAAKKREDAVVMALTI